LYAGWESVEEASDWGWRSRDEHPREAKEHAVGVAGGLARRIAQRFA
jgi:hypothetical protein